MRLCNRCDTLRFLDEVGDLSRHGLRIRRHPDGADCGTGKPGQNQFRTVIGVQEDLVPSAHPSFHEAGRKTPGLVEQLPVAPASAPIAWRIPDEHGVIRAVLGPVGKQPGDVLAVHLKLLECVSIHPRSIA